MSEASPEEASFVPSCGRRVPRRLGAWARRFRSLVRSISVALQGHEPRARTDTEHRRLHRPALADSSIPRSALGCADCPGRTGSSRTLVSRTSDRYARVLARVTYKTILARGRAHVQASPELLIDTRGCSGPAHKAPISHTTFLLVHLAAVLPEQGRR
ncbi:hypothetical protein BV20DRAFT_367005 [Pilatotrama ljubarskyi]|nr:hypothetical protein BV20DRAFT_367005 [Pilatotrama ljubarskyi]